MGKLAIKDLKQAIARIKHIRENTEDHVGRFYRHQQGRFFYRQARRILQAVVYNVYSPGSYRRRKYGGGILGSLRTATGHRGIAIGISSTAPVLRTRTRRRPGGGPYARGNNPRNRRGGRKAWERAKYVAEYAYYLARRRGGFLRNIPALKGTLPRRFGKAWLSFFRKTTPMRFNRMVIGGVFAKARRIRG